MAEEAYIKIKSKAIKLINKTINEILEEDLKMRNLNSFTKQIMEDDYRLTINIIYSIKDDFRLNSTYINPFKPNKNNSRLWNISENYYFPTIEKDKILHLFLEAYIE
jgi:hypothetical protein